MIRTADIVKQLSKDLGYDQDQSLSIVMNIIRQMKEELLKWSDVVINQFFMLSVKDTMWRSVKSKITWVTTEAKIYRRLKCRFFKKFKDEVKNKK